MTDLTDRLAESARALAKSIHMEVCLCRIVPEPPCIRCRYKRVRTVLAEYDAVRAATRDHDDADREEAES